MKNKTGWVVVGLACLSIAGCSMGMAPAGPSPDQAKKEFESQPLDKKIAIINGSPSSPEQKAQMIKDAKAMAGVKDDGTTPVASPSGAPAAAGGGK